MLLGTAMYGQVDGKTSVFLYAYLDKALGGPAFFYVTGLALGFGYNRKVDVPLEKIKDFPLVKQAIEGGIKCIEHGNLINDEIAKMMSENDVWLSPQVVVYLTFSPDLGPVRLAKGKMVTDGLDNMFRLAKKYNLKIAFGTDVVVNPKAAAAQNREFVERAKWFTPAEILTQATANSGELLQLSGDRSPYPGVIGKIEEGAYADILLINGNPLDDISILAKPHENLDLIMKDGKIYKNTIN
jgi:imidazolonepropionase-like amidohydrolase